jgi:AcrR family transcriptional regulator
MRFTRTKVAFLTSGGRLAGRTGRSVRPVSNPSATEPSSRRELAVSRTADPARARAELRVQTFLDAARELMNTSDGNDFTLQMVVERSGQSLRSFYQHFAGKHELLLALFEESVQAAADQLTTEIQDIDDPFERLRAFAVRYHRMCLSGTARYAEKPLQSRATAQFAHQLLIYHPAEASQAFLPLISILGELLDDAARVRAIRTDLDAEVSGVLLQAIMFNAFVPTIAGTPGFEDAERAADRLWELLFHGLAPSPT